MKRNIRFYLALFTAKITYRALRLLGRKGTNVPGELALYICPDFLGRVQLPERVIAITGTNGKTTVSNMVEDVLDDCGWQYTCNRMGGNVNTGLISTLVSHSSPLGKPKHNLAVFEVDERSAPLLLPYIKPDILVCTNLFRDSYKRNAHTEFIFSLLNDYIPDSTKLILNGDDLISSRLKEKNENRFFGIAKEDGEDGEMKNIVCDIRSCPKCGETLEWDFIRYHHIGQAHCPHCDFASPPLDYVITNIDREKLTFTLQYDGKTHEFPIINVNFINIYNSLAAISLLITLGLSPDTIAASMQKMSISESRYAEEKFHGKDIIMHLAKGQNPIACSRAFENAKDYPGSKAVLLYLDDYYDATYSVENIAWFYDTDFEFLKDDSITQIMISGVRHHDLYVRLLIAGVSKEKMTHCVKPEDAIEEYLPEKAETLFVIYDLFNLDAANAVKKRGKELILEAEKEAQA
ncbi:Mur ligase family protein [Scatolibacter rhodanostii]|uniref:Mur ligase family protein n=1 Tax=Scatolibacter rhodanostii TaxID=2014781 RepID=UPI0013565523|nr:Mur ligase family protein [Scatolibacter rhodanostii]